MPGITLCGRCGSNLQLEQAPTDVHPPRASARKKRIRRWIPSTSPARERLQALANNIFQNDGTFEWPVFWRTVVPGWSHQYCGYHTRAKVFFFLYLSFLALGLLFLGTLIGSLFLGLAISCHVSSILDLLLTRHHSTGRRVLLSLLACGFLFCLIYYPAWSLIRRVALPSSIRADAPPLMAGDVLLTQTVFPPDVGDVVVYEVPYFRANGTTQLGQAAMIDFVGQRVDRILAGPGQTVEIKDGKVRVDGRPAAARPLNPGQFHTMKQMTVGSRQWFILPSTDPYAPQATDALPQLGLVDQSRVQGTVWFRSHPLLRIGRVTGLSEE